MAHIIDVARSHMRDETVATARARGHALATVIEIVADGVPVEPSGDRAR